MRSQPRNSELCTDLGTVGYASGPGIQNARNPDAEHGVDGTDVTHRITIAGLYDLPFGHNRRFLNNSQLANRLIVGFQFNTIMTAETGRPLFFSGASNYAATRPNFVPGVGVRVPHPRRTQWFNTAAFSNHADYKFGDAPRYYSEVRGPGAINFDVSAFRTTSITEQVRRAFRIEAFNAFNHLNLGTPNTSFSAGPPADSVNPTAEGGKNGQTKERAARRKKIFSSCRLRLHQTAQGKTSPLRHFELSPRLCRCGHTVTIPSPTTLVENPARTGSRWAA